MYTGYEFFTKFLVFNKNPVHSVVTHMKKKNYPRVSLNLLSCHAITLNLSRQRTTGHL